MKGEGLRFLYVYERAVYFTTEKSLLELKNNLHYKLPLLIAYNYT